MSEIFGVSYAAGYDLFYADKDYRGEVERVRGVLAKHAHEQPASVLDLGCGTAGHAIPFAQLGYEVVGIDRSPEMLEIARAKVIDAQVDIEFHTGDLRTLELGRRFDVAIAMFAVLGYQSSNEDVENALRSVRRHLNDRGLFVFDVWFGPAVISQRPAHRFRAFEVGGSTHLRASSGTLDISAHTCDVAISTWQIAGNRVISTSDESHTMRFFFPQELSLFARHAGFELVELTPFPNEDAPLDVTTWNVLGVMRAL